MFDFTLQMSYSNFFRLIKSLSCFSFISQLPSSNIYYSVKSQYCFLFCLLFVVNKLAIIIKKLKKKTSLCSQNTFQWFLQNTFIEERKKHKHDHKTFLKILFVIQDMWQWSVTYIHIGIFLALNCMLCWYCNRIYIYSRFYRN